MFAFSFSTNFAAQAQSDYQKTVLASRMARENDFRNPQISPLSPKEIKKFQGLLWYEVDDRFRVGAKFKRLPDQPLMQLSTFGNQRTLPYRKYGELNFILDRRNYTLNVYQSEVYAANKFLIVMFNDLTNTDETYRGGRYIDFRYPSGEDVILDFNLAYQPDCAFNEDFICPVPPPENKLNFYARAGERLFAVKGKYVEEFDGVTDKITLPPRLNVSPEVAAKSKEYEARKQIEREKQAAVAREREAERARLRAAQAERAAVENARPEIDGAPQITRERAVKKVKEKEKERAKAEREEEKARREEEKSVPKTAAKSSPTVETKREKPADTVSAAAPKTSSEGNFADYNGSKVFYKSVGQGDRAIIFVHGWTGNSELWKASVNDFPNIRTIALDLPGHGRSDAPRTDYTIDYFARSIEAVMKDAGVKKALLVGHSMGTPVITQFYRNSPDKTLGLVVVDGALRQTYSKEMMEKVFAPIFENYQENVSKFIQTMTPAASSEVSRRILDSALAMPDYVAQSAARGMMDESIWKNDKIKVPVLAVMAAGNWKPETKAQYQEIAPKLDYRSWTDVDHFLFMERPAEFNSALKFFIRINALF